MASIVIGGSVAFLTYIFNKKNPDAIPVSKLNSAQLHGHKIFSGYNRLSVPNQICDCSKKGGFETMQVNNQYSSNNWLQCRCKNGNGNGKGSPLKNNIFGNATGFKNGNENGNAGYCYKYRKFGCQKTEKKDHLSFIHSTKKCNSVVGFVQNPICESCHSVSKSGENPQQFYTF